ncbi:hypothetical protein LTR09_005173 [Extremus antarcticus]|uniref:PH domain-like protein n=1 Tax=Extremus antarcticus TaxID=702011 RepID=A0AAJ0DGY1_9PEZI|nr:hypothetical protein LTR09_005173 [Extremus antarcticus]
MPPKMKNATRTAQHQPLPTQSDFESDTAANLTESNFHTANTAMRTNPADLNLAVLRRYVPDLERIVTIAPFAVVYVFSPETQQWEKSGVEGTLFVCQLSGLQTPRYNVVILNRKSLDNFITELVSEEDIEITEQYVILQVLGEDEVPTIYGLWIFSEEGEGVHSTREIVANSIQECAMRAAHANLTADEDIEEDYAPPAPYNLDGTSESYVENGGPPPQPETSGQPIDLLSLFGKSAAIPSLAQNGHGTNVVNQNSEQSRFIPPPDTDFFRASNSPAAPTQAQTGPPPQQNALLGLFKNTNYG